MASSIDLTEDERQQRADTRPGQAHFAGTGPPGKRCAQCNFMLADDSRSFKKIGRCIKAMNLMRPTMPPKFSVWARACKYFVDKGDDQ